VRPQGDAMTAFDAIGLDADDTLWEN